MNVKHLFGKPLPSYLKPKPLVRGRSLMASLGLFAVAGLTIWVVKALLTKDTKETEEMVYFWPE